MRFENIFGEISRAKKLVCFLLFSILTLIYISPSLLLCTLYLSLSEKIGSHSPLVNRFFHLRSDFENLDANITVDLAVRASRSFQGDGDWMWRITFLASERAGL